MLIGYFNYLSYNRRLKDSFRTMSCESNVTVLIIVLLEDFLIFISFLGGNVYFMYTMFCSFTLYPAYNRLDLVLRVKTLSLPYSGKGLRDCGLSCYY